MEPKQYFEAVPVSSDEMPEGDKYRKCFAIDIDGIYDCHYCEYIQRHPEKYTHWLKPVSMEEVIREVAGKAWDAGFNRGVDQQNVLSFSRQRHLFTIT